MGFFSFSYGYSIYGLCLTFWTNEFLGSYSNNGFSISSLFLSLFVFLWIGAQFPQEKFLSYGRILTLDFYFLLMCILFLLLFLFYFYFSFHLLIGIFLSPC